MRGQQGGVSQPQMWGLCHRLAVLQSCREQPGNHCQDLSPIFSERTAAAGLSSTPMQLGTL